MAEHEKKEGFFSKIADKLIYVSNLASGKIDTQIKNRTEQVMNDIDLRILQIEKRVFRKISSLLIIWFGLALLILALAFFLIESLKFTSTQAYFSVGIILFIIGLLLKINEHNK